MKSATNSERSNNRKGAHKLLDTFYKCRKDSDSELIDKDNAKAM